MVCVAIKGKPVIGVIFKPFETKQNSSLFWSWTNHAISRNLQVLLKVTYIKNINNMSYKFFLFNKPVRR